MSALMYYCTFTALRCSLGLAWTIIMLIKSTSLDESGQRQREAERACVCVFTICDSVCVHLRSVFCSLYPGDWQRK